MLLVVDIGNSHTVIGLYVGPLLRHHWRLQTLVKNTADELAVQLHGLFAHHRLELQAISGAIVASVVPILSKSWRTLLTTLTANPIMVGEVLDRLGMKIRTDQPSQVGVDRLVNAVAAYDRFPGPLIVIDCGTAITFDCVSAGGEFLGGAIAPGMAIAMEALASRTAQLPQVDLTTPPPAAIGTNTVAAIKSGVLYGYGGLVEGLVTRLAAQFEAAQPPKVIATGGMAALIAPQAPSISTVAPYLTLEGLRLIHARVS